MAVYYCLLIFNRFTLMNYRTLCLIGMRSKELPIIVDSIQWQSNPSEDEKLINCANEGIWVFLTVNKYQLPKNRKEAIAIIIYQNIIGNCIIENYEEALQTYKTTYVILFNHRFWNIYLKICSSILNLLWIAYKNYRINLLVELALFCI